MPNLRIKSKPQNRRIWGNFGLVFWGWEFALYGGQNFHNLISILRGYLTGGDWI